MAARGARDDNMGKSIWIGVAAVVVVVIVALAAFMFLFPKDNEAQGLQPDLDSFPSKWVVDSDYSTTYTTEDVKSFSRERYTNASNTEQITVQIYVYSSIGQAYDKYNSERIDWSGIEHMGPPMDRYFKYGYYNTYCFVYGNIYGEVILIDTVGVDFIPIFEDIEDKASEIVMHPV